MQPALSMSVTEGSGMVNKQLPLATVSAEKEASLFLALNEAEAEHIGT